MLPGVVHTYYNISVAITMLRFNTMQYETVAQSLMQQHEADT
jgi:hypothetical protein